VSRVDACSGLQTLTLLKPSGFDACMRRQPGTKNVSRFVVVRICRSPVIELLLIHLNWSQGDGRIQGNPSTRKLTAGLSEVVVSRVGTAYIHNNKGSHKREIFLRVDKELNSKYLFFVCYYICSALLLPPLSKVSMLFYSKPKVCYKVVHIVCLISGFSV
jgi:hypothetical protein